MKMFDYLQFNNRLGKLSSRETEYWHMMFKKILKVGEEFEVQIPEDTDLDDTYRDLHQELKPSNSMFHHGEVGIKEVVGDGSVPHGVEVVTVGKRFDWNTFYNMNVKIMDALKGQQAKSSHHTGMHIHLLAGYHNNDITDLERNVPEIILANFYQLHRIFAPELYWIASGGKDDYALTRYILFRRPPFLFSAVNTPMEIIKAEMFEKYGKYQMVNMNFCQFVNSRELSTFHVEIRHPDTHLSPAYATALVALEVALLHKAIDLSQCGIISIKQDEYDFKKAIFDKFVNLGTGDRDSDSTDLTSDDIASLQIRTTAMIRWLKSELYSINTVSYDILKQIGFAPASMMRIDGMDWDEIEKTIYTPQLVNRDTVDKLIEIIILQQITDCEDQREWMRAVASKLEVTQTKVREMFSAMSSERIVSFDKELGGMIFQQVV